MCALRDVDRASLHYRLRVDALAQDYKQSRQLIKEYEATQTLLQTLPNQLKHRIQIPFGSHCFTEGNLVHTNEVQVLLGDNYFIQCSASHAVGICERRIQHVQTKVKAIKLEQDSLNESIKHSNSLFDQTVNEDGEEIVEIKEEYHSGDDDDDDIQSHQQHQSSSSSSSTELSSSSLSQHSTRTSALTGRGDLTDVEFDSYWDMLAEAEAQHDDNASSDQELELSHDHQHDDMVHENEDETSHLSSIQSPADIFANIQARKMRNTTNDTSNNGMKTSSIKHHTTVTQSPINQSTKRVSFSEAPPDVAHINKMSTTSIPVNSHKQIASNQSFKSVVSSLPSSHLDIDGPPSSNPAMRSAFSGSIMERADSHVDMMNTTTAPTKKLSKFKAARMGLIHDEDD